METGIAKINLELNVKYSDGSRRRLNSNKVALRDADGETIGVLVTTEDITDRKQAEQALRDSEMRFGVLVNGVRDYAIYLVDTKGKIVTWNSRRGTHQRVYCTGNHRQHISTFYTPDDIAADEPERLLKTASIEGHYIYEGNRVRKDGTVVLG